MKDYFYEPGDFIPDEDDDIFSEFKAPINARLNALPLSDAERTVVAKACLHLEIEGRYDSQLLNIIEKIR